MLETSWVGGRLLTASSAGPQILQRQGHVKVTINTIKKAIQMKVERGK